MAASRSLTGWRLEREREREREREQERERERVSVQDQIKKRRGRPGETKKSETEPGRGGWREPDGNGVQRRPVRERRVA